MRNDKDWSAEDFDESFYVDDEWIKENTKEVDDGWDGQEQR